MLKGSVAASKWLLCRCSSEALNVMDAAKSFKYLKACLVKRLVTSGFVANGDTVSRQVRDTVVVIEVQKDRKYSTED